MSVEKAFTRVTVLPGPGTRTMTPCLRSFQARDELAERLVIARELNSIRKQHCRGSTVFSESAFSPASPS